MKEGPDIALLGSLIGDPARANILTALMSGKALTATELAGEAGVTVQTASSHLSKLEAVDLIRQQKQGRHRYFSLADSDVGDLLESMMGLAANRGLVRTRTGPKDQELRKARVCYNHLAGDYGVWFYDGLVSNGLIKDADGSLALSTAGNDFVGSFGIDLERLAKNRRPMCKSCLDWSSRRNHLAGSLGTAFLNRFIELGWAKRRSGSRVIQFSATGERHFHSIFNGKTPA